MLAIINLYSSSEQVPMPFSYDLKISPLKNNYDIGDSIAVSLSIKPFPEGYYNFANEEDAFFLVNDYTIDSVIEIDNSLTGNTPIAKVISNSINDSLIFLGDYNRDIDLFITAVMLDKTDKIVISFPAFTLLSNIDSKGHLFNYNGQKYRGDHTKSIHNSTKSINLSLLTINGEPNYLIGGDFLGDRNKVRVNYLDDNSGLIGFTFYNRLDNNQDMILIILYSDSTNAHGKSESSFPEFDTSRNSETDYFPTHISGLGNLQFSIRNGADLINSSQICAGGLELELQENWFWKISFIINNFDPYQFSSNVYKKQVLPLAEEFQTVENDSLYIIWGGDYIFPKR
jgi:hypothetical protein